MQGSSHITEDSCSASVGSNPPAVSRAEQVLNPLNTGSEPEALWRTSKPIPRLGSRFTTAGWKESEAPESATLLRASDTQEGGWEHQGEVCNWISVYFGPRLRSMHNEEVIRWLILARALRWDKVSTVPTGKMGGCQMARVQPYIIHFYSWSNFLDQVWEGKEHSFVVAWGIGNPGFIRNVLIWMDRKTQYEHTLLALFHIHHDNKTYAVISRGFLYLKNHRCTFLRSISLLSSLINDTSSRSKTKT